MPISSNSGHCVLLQDKKVPNEHSFLPIQRLMERIRYVGGENVGNSFPESHLSIVAASFAMGAVWV
jgi:hypothetical protein